VSRVAPSRGDEVQSELVDRLLRHFERRNRDVEVPGAAVLLRVLIRRGLPEEALPAACLLIQELDTPRDVDELAEQTPEERLESRQRIHLGVEGPGRKPHFQRTTRRHGPIGAGKPRPRDPDRPTG
jgi:hypothetical protein